MKSRQATPHTAANNALSAIALAVLAVWINPAIASSGVDTLCDPSTAIVVSLEVPPAKLDIAVVDHGPANSVGAGGADAGQLRTLQPSDELILRRIFDEPRVPASDDAEPAGGDSLNAPLADENSSEREDPATSGDVTEDGETVTRLPGVSEDELLRFRRQMYRVDI